MFVDCIIIYGMSIDEQAVYDIIKNTQRDKLVVGSNQVKAALSHNLLNMVIIGLDSQTSKVSDMVKRCNAHKTQWFSVSHSKQLGASVGIDVACLCVGIYK